MPTEIAKKPAAELSICNCEVDDVRRHLLEGRVLLQINERLGPHVRDVLSEQGVHQSHQLASSKNEGTFMLILGDFVVLAPVVGFVFQVELAESIGAKDEVVSQVAVADFGQASMLRDRTAAGALLPSQAHILSQMLVFIKAGNIHDLSQDAGGDDSSQAFDGDDGVGKGLDIVGDVLVQAFHRALDEANVFPTSGQGSRNHFVHRGFNGVRSTQGFANSPGGTCGIIEASMAATADQVDQLIMGHQLKLSGGEFGQKGCAGGAKDVRKGFDPFPVTALEESVGLKAVFLARKVA